MKVKTRDLDVYLQPQNPSLPHLTLLVKEVVTSEYQMRQSSCVLKNPNTPWGNGIQNFSKLFVYLSLVTKGDEFEVSIILYDQFSYLGSQCDTPKFRVETVNGRYTGTFLMNDRNTELKEWISFSVVIRHRISQQHLLPF